MVSKSKARVKGARAKKELVSFGGRKVVPIKRRTDYQMMMKSCGVDVI